ncbi:hypothetical protein ONE63_003419 [Megalurothrips usitatus]|uniref:Uncharacterized protein n=1 Tax=Megalurothrips usitatus TaxID=439358 RepID=A0AAV7X785_9NEOP|nr:hypothetical protein ONE63_003419 [Megalurothrips usitatus]
MPRLPSCRIEFDPITLSRYSVSGNSDRWDHIGDRFADDSPPKITSPLLQPISQSSAAEPLARNPATCAVNSVPRTTSS